MVTGNDILSYTGSAALGLNSDGLAEYGDTDAKDLNNSLFNMAYLNLQKNKTIYEQKIRDRDAGMKLIADGELEINDALPADRELLMKKIDAIKKVYFDNKGDVKSDPRIWLDVNAKLADFKTANNVAKSRLAMYKGGKDAAARETNPIKQKRQDAHWERQLKEKDIYTPFDPYQQTFDYDVKTSMPGVQLITTTKADGLDDVTETRTDSKGTFEKYVLDYVANDKGETQPNIDGHFDDFFGQNKMRSPEAVAYDVQIVNDKLKKIAAIEGFDINNIDSLPDYLKPIKIRNNGDGGIDVSDRKDVAMAKVNLASNYKSGTTRTPNKERADIELKKAQAEKAKKEGQAALIDANANKKLKGAQAEYHRAKAAGQNIKNKAEQEKNAAENPYSYIPTVVQKTSNGTFFIEKKDVPLFLQDIMGGVGKDGKPIPLPPEKTSIKRGNEIVEGYYFKPLPDQFYTSDGDGYSKADIGKLAAKRGLSYDEMLQELLDKQVIYQDGEVFTKKGKGTRLSTFQSAKAINNKAAGKGDEDVMVDE